METRPVAWLVFHLLLCLSTAQTLVCKESSTFQDDVRNASPETTKIDCSTKRYGGFIPTEIGRLTNVVRIRAQRNELYGTLPSEIGHLTGLTDLDVRENHLGGTLPSEIGRLGELSRLRMGHNSWNWTLPYTFSNLRSLKVLGLSFSGLTQIPDAFLELKSLESIVARGNDIKEKMPKGFGELIRLTRLDLSENEFSGTLPVELGRLRNMEEFKVVGNRLSGSIPTQLGFWAQLQKLSLNDNLLVSTLPTELGLLTTLGEALFQENGLSSTIPTFIGNMVDLRWLQLESNVFTGALPIELAKLTRLTYFRHDQTLFKPCELQLDERIDGWEVPAQCVVPLETSQPTSSPRGEQLPTSSPAASEKSAAPTRSPGSPSTTPPAQRPQPANDETAAFTWSEGWIVVTFLLALLTNGCAAVVCCVRYKKLRKLETSSHSRKDTSTSSSIPSRKMQEVSLN